MLSVRRAVALCLMLPLSSAVAITLGGGGDPRPLDPAQKFDFSAPPAASAGTYVATQAEGKLKGIKRVAITNMCVQFINSKSAQGYSRGSSISYNRSAEGAIPGGLDEARMQAVADAWLEQIETDFRAAGIEVVPYEEVAANALFQKFSAKYDKGIRVGVSSDRNNQKGDTAETSVYVSPKGRPFAMDCGTISPASTSTFVRMAYPLNAEFLTISGVVDMGLAKATGGLLRGAKVDIDYVQYLRAGDSQFQFIGKMGPGARLWLKQSIVPQQDPFTLGAVEKGDTEKTTDDLSGITTRTTGTTQTISMDEDLYYRNAAEALRAMHQMFLALLASKQ